MEEFKILSKVCVENFFKINCSSSEQHLNYPKTKLVFSDC